MRSNNSSAQPPPTTTLLTTLHRQHEDFAASRRFAHVPRSRYLKQLDNHVHSDTEFPLLIQAPSGAGKSALLAYWAAEYRKENPRVFIVQHYAGCSQEESDYQDFIRHTMLAIQSRFAVPKELPMTPEKLVEEFPAWLWYAREPTVIILDALDQLQNSGHGFQWLPTSMPPTMRWILSTRDDSSASAQAPKSWKTMQLPPFTLVERQQLVRQFVETKKATLTSRQQRIVAGDAGSANPLLLKTRLEEAHSAVADHRVDESINYYLGAGTLDEMYSRLLQRLEAELDKRTVREVLSFLWGAKTGLTLEEIIDLTESEPEQILSVTHRLEAYLLQTEKRFTLFHTSLAQAAHQRWLQTRATKVRLRIADYFQNAPTTLRSIREQIHQLSDLGLWDRLARLFADIPTFVQSFQFLRYEMLRCLNNFPSSFDLIQEYTNSLRAYSHIASTENVVEALQSMGRLFEVTGNVDAAGELYTWGLEHVDLSKDQSLRATLLTHLGNLNTRRGEYKQAENLLEESLQILRNQNAMERASGVLSDLGTIAFYRGEYKRAEEIFIESLERAEADTNADEAARIRGNLGVVYVRVGQLDNAEECLRQILRYAEQAGDIEKEMTATANLGVVKEGAGDNEEAFALYKRSHHLAKTLGNKGHLANMHGNMGNILIRIQRPEEGIEQCERQKKLANDLQSQVQVAHALTSIGTGRTMQGRYNEALLAFQGACESYIQIEDRYGEGLVYGRLGYLFLHQGKPLEAAPYFNKEQEIAQRTASLPLHLDAITGLGHACRDQGDFDRAEAYYQELLKQATEIKDNKRMVEATASLGVVASRRGSWNEGLRQLNYSITMNASAPEDLAFWLLEKATLLFKQGSRESDIASITEAKEVLERIINMNLYDSPIGLKNRARSLLTEIASQHTTPSAEKNF